MEIVSRDHRQVKLNKAWIFIGIIFNIKLPLIGEIYLGEIALIPIFIWVISNSRIAKEIRLLLIFCFLWAFFQLLSDITNQSEILSTAKGVAAPIILGISIVALSVIFSNHTDRIRGFLIGICICNIATGIIFPTEYQIENFWKWGAGQAVLTILLALACSPTKRRNFLPLLILGGNLIIGMFFAARSLAILPLIGLIFFYVTQSNSRFVQILKGIKFPFVALVVIATLLSGVITTSSRYIFESELLDEILPKDVLLKYRQQALSDAGILLAGRSEILVSSRAFFDAPLLGHGSWALDNSGYVAQYAELRKEFGVTETTDELNSIYIPTHSFLMGGIVWGGIIVGIAWVLITNLALRCYLHNASNIQLYAHILFTIFLWDFFFSPFGATARWSSAICLAIIFSTTLNTNIRKKI
ncbi:MAG TPA: hypothetical protein DDZ41_11125 [Flavobacterium sp.]|nr:hypothetical protein [Flavobacterium sp.]